MKGFVYILKNSADRFYIGSTVNVEKRFSQHVKGHTQTTRNMGELKPILIQEYASLSIARKIERKLKRLKRKDYLEKMVKDGYIGIK